MAIIYKILSMERYERVEKKINFADFFNLYFQLVEGEELQRLRKKKNKNVSTKFSLFIFVFA